MKYVMAIVECEGIFAAVLKTKGPKEILNRLNGIGGKVEQDELLTTAMNREWLEETNVPLDFAASCWGNLSGDGWEMSVFYKKVDYMFDLPEKNDADESLCWVPENEFLYQGVPNLQWMIPLCREKVYFNCWEAPYL